MKSITKIKVKIESISPLHIGDDEGNILINSEENLAYLPATSVAGSFRAYLKQNDKNYKKLLGNQDKNEGAMSKVFISDSYAEVKNLEKRIGVKIHRKTGSNEGGAKIDREYLGKGLIFNLIFEIHCDNCEKDELKEMLYGCIKALNENHIKLGGYKTAGLGNFKVNSVEEREYNFKKVVDLGSYLTKESEALEDVTDRVMKCKLDDGLVEFILKGELTTPLLIKAPDTLESHGPDGKNIKSGGNYIIPGSSIKGMLRARIEKIAEYFGKEQIVEEIFGSDSEKKASSIMVNGAVVDDKGYDNSIVYNRIKIDRFTGGTMNTALIKDLPIMGKTEFKIIYKKSKEYELDDFVIGITSLALRDLACENLSIGGGSSVGRGKFKGENMLLSDGEKKIEIDFINKKVKGEEILAKYINSVSNYKIS